MNDNEEEKGFDQQFVSKTTSEPREAFDVMVSKLKARKGLRWKHRKITREAYLNAVWLWMEQLGPDAVEKGIAPILPRLEAMLKPIEPKAGATREDEGGAIFPKGKPEPSPKRKRSG